MFITQFWKANTKTYLTEKLSGIKKGKVNFELVLKNGTLFSRHDLKDKFEIHPPKTFYSKLTQLLREESPWLWDLFGGLKEQKI